MEVTEVTRGGALREAPSRWAVFERRCVALLRWLDIREQCANYFGCPCVGTSAGRELG
jgi:hypothetical protein